MLIPCFALLPIPYHLLSNAASISPVDRSSDPKREKQRKMKAGCVWLSIEDERMKNMKGFIKEYN